MADHRLEHENTGVHLLAVAIVLSTWIAVHAWNDHEQRSYTNQDPACPSWQSNETGPAPIHLKTVAPIGENHHG